MVSLPRIIPVVAAASAAARWARSRQLRAEATNASPAAVGSTRRLLRAISPLTGGARVGRTALTALAPTVWGTTYIVTTHLLPEGHPLFAALMRALPAGLLAVLIARQLPRGAWWWKSLVLGTLNMGAFFPLLFVAAQHLPGGVAATLGAAQPIVVALLAVVVLNERLSRWRLFWALAGVTGVALVVLGPEAGLDFVGVLAGLGGAASCCLFLRCSSTERLPASTCLRSPDTCGLGSSAVCWRTRCGSPASAHCR